MLQVIVARDTVRQVGVLVLELSVRCPTLKIDCGSSLQLSEFDFEVGMPNSTSAVTGLPGDFGLLADRVWPCQASTR